jgi:hypothetical protein
MTVVKETSKYKSDLVVVLVVRWDSGGTEPADKYIFFSNREVIH